MSTALPRRGCRPIAIAAAAAAALTGTVLTALVPAAPAVAATGDTITVAPASGTSLDEAATHTVSSSLSCPDGSTGVKLYVSDAVPDGPAEANWQGSYLYLEESGTTPNAPGLIAAMDAPVAITAGQPVPAFDGAFPGGAQGWTNPTSLVDPSPQTKPLSEWLSADNTYGLVMVCETDEWDTLATETVTDPVGGTTTTYIAMAWTSLTVNPDGSWYVGSQAPATATTTALTAAAADGNKATLHAAVTAGATTVGDGKVEFYEHGSSDTKLGEQNVAAGVADFTTDALSSGTHTFFAKYVPASGAYEASTSDQANVIIAAPGDQTTTSVALVVVWAVAPNGAIKIALTGGVQQDGQLATDAAGTIQFARNGQNVGAPVTVQSGVASYLDADAALAFDTEYAYTAAFTPADGSDLEAATSDPATVTIAGPTDLVAGATVEPGGLYKVTAPDDTFDANETVDGVVHSTPVAVGSVTATAAGGATFVFQVPTGLEADVQHSLVLTGASGKTYTVAFSLAAAPADDPTDDPTTTPISNNQGVRFATDWVEATASTPAGIGALVAGVILLATGGVLGWNVWWRRRGQSAPTA